MKYLISLFFMAISTGLQAQSFKNDQEKGNYYMEKAQKVFENKRKYAIKFETAVFQLKKPLDVFAAPAYKQYKGGYLYVDGAKYEYNLGMVKVLCDSKVLIYIDEVNKQIVVDSVRDHGVTDEERTKLFLDMFEESNGAFVYQYQKIDTILGKTYHKIRCTVTKNKAVHMIYWIHTTTGQMYMYAEYNEGLYNVYIIDKITTPPLNHKYQIYLPKTELTTFHGYEVADHRFVMHYDKNLYKQKMKDFTK